MTDNRIAQSAQEKQRELPIDYPTHIENGVTILKSINNKTNSFAAAHGAVISRKVNKLIRDQAHRHSIS